MQADPSPTLTEADLLAALAQLKARRLTPTAAWIERPAAEQPAAEKDAAP